MIPVNNRRVVTRRGNHLKEILKSTEAFFLISPEADRRSAEGDIQKKLKSILIFPEGGYLDSLLLAGYVCNLLMTLSLGNSSRRRVSYFEISKFQIYLEKPWCVMHK